MRTVAIINQKGGCGKTTTSINLAACLARLGHKTLLVDMDPQGHCGVGLAVPEEQIERTIYDTLIEPVDGKVAAISEIVWQIATDFDLAPSNIRLAAFEQVFAGRTGRDERLKNSLSPAQSSYQWCIIDCPPNVGLLTFNALKACDEVIVPVETGFFSLHGLAKMMETLEVLRERCSHDILIRVLPTLYDTRTKLAREVLSELRNKFKEYLMESTVNFNTKLKEAASFGQPITEYDPGSRGYKDFVNLARELMGHRPAEVVQEPLEKMSRPAELVARARQLAQLTSHQFGKHAMAAQAPVEQPSAPLHAEHRFGVREDSGFAAPAFAPSKGQSIFGSHAHPHVPLQHESSLLSAQAAIAPSIFGGASALDSALSGATTVSGGYGSSRSSESETMVQLRPAIYSQSSVFSAARTTEQKIEDFYGVKQVGAEVIFAARFEEAKNVLIAGDFNNWSPMATPMITGGRPGEWRTAIPLAPGRYRYRLVVDGQWITDPNNNRVETNQFGELDNVVEVG